MLKRYFYNLLREIEHTFYTLDTLSISKFWNNDAIDIRTYIKFEDITYHMTWHTSETYLELRTYIVH